MTDIGSNVGIANLMVPGIIIGVVGMCIAALAYPAYTKTIKTERAKIAPEILRLTEELMK